MMLISLQSHYIARLNGLALKIDYRRDDPVLSLTNVKYMVQFAKGYPDFIISQAVFGQITWSHNI